MFRRLAEAFQDSGDHSQYANNQTAYFNALPNMILSPTSGLKGFDVAIQSIDSQGRAYQKPAIKEPNRIFMQDSSPDLNNLAKQCASSSIDDLIAIKNPNAGIGCGWVYTPPNQGSPYPVVSQGTIGDSNAPLQNFGTPEYKKYFFDLQLAKKQILLDKCKALKACTDVDSDVFNGVCGYCTDTNQGIPIDSSGQPLYGGDPLGSCSPQSIVTSGTGCPPPPGSGPGPQPIIDKTCDPVNGRLPAACLYNQVIAAGCSDNGTLAIALANPTDPSNYIGGITNSNAVKIYNRVANPPLSMDTFNKGATTVANVLQEARQLVGNTKQPANSALGAAARDLCLQKGAISQYNFCNDVPDTTMPPFDMGCLQQLFRKMGGQPTGTAYPSDGSQSWTTNTMPTYNSMPNLGAVKQYFNTLIANMNSSDYNTQRTAMTQFLGISPERLIKRAPYNQGVEVIWCQASAGTTRIAGVLRRTIEKDFVQFGGGISSNNAPIPQLASIYPGFTQYAAMMQITDVRAPQDFAIKWSFTVDDGASISVNQPTSFDYKALNTPIADQPGYVANVQLQVATYNFNSCQQFNANFPNITKIFYTDAGGGGHTFNLSSAPCSGSPTMSAPYYSLTLEPRAPFINYEVNLNSANLEDTRNPGIFSQLCTNQNLEYHVKQEELTYVPGNKGFVRYNNADSITNIFNIAYQAWGTVTFAFRLQSMPVKDAIFSFWVSNKYCVFYLQPVNGSTAQMRVQTNMTTDGSTYDGATAFNLQVGTWYYMEVAQNGSGFDVYCDSITNIIKNGNYTTQYTRITNNGPISTTTNNGLYLPNQLSCNITIGGKGSGFNYYSSAFQFDVAWVHFFDSYINGGDVVKDCQASWQFTQFPDSYNTYKRF